MSVTTEVTAVVTTAGAAPVTAAAATPAAGAAAGAVYRIAPDGVWDVVWRSSEDTPYDLAVDGPDRVLIGTGGRGKVFRVTGSPPRTLLLTRAPAQQVTSFASGPDSGLYYTTANPARLYRLSTELADEGRYLSDVRDAGTVATWGAIRWRARTPGPSSVRLFTRSGNTPTPGETWSEWSDAYADSDGTPIASPKARYLQWRASLRRGDAPPRDADAPTLLSVTTAYLPRNLRPEVTALTVHPPGEAFQETFGSDPPLAGFDRGARDGEGPGGASAGNAQSPTLGRRVFRKGLRTFTWTARDGNQDRLRFDLGYRPEDAPDWQVLAEDLAATIFTWDTTSVPDGTYEVRVEATDALSNPPGAALAGSLASMPFDVDNAPPEIAFGQAREDVPGEMLVTFTVRDSHSPVLRVEYAAGPGRWQVVHPADGVPDSREEERFVRCRSRSRPGARADRAGHGRHGQRDDGGVAAHRHQPGTLWAPTPPRLVSRRRRAGRPLGPGTFWAPTRRDPSPPQVGRRGAAGSLVGDLDVPVAPGPLDPLRRRVPARALPGGVDVDEHLRVVRGERLDQRPRDLQRPREVAELDLDGHHAVRRRHPQDLPVLVDEGAVGAGEGGTAPAGPGVLRRRFCRRRAAGRDGDSRAGDGGQGHSGAHRSGARRRPKRQPTRHRALGQSRRPGRTVRAGVVPSSGCYEGGLAAAAAKPVSWRAHARPSSSWAKWKPSA